MYSCTRGFYCKKGHWETKDPTIWCYWWWKDIGSALQHYYFTFLGKRKISVVISENCWRISFCWQIVSWELEWRIQGKQQETLRHTWMVLLWLSSSWICWRPTVWTLVQNAKWNYVEYIYWGKPLYSSYVEQIMLCLASNVSFSHLNGWPLIVYTAMTRGTRRAT